ncbi:MAG: formimidoylglutamate deiminase [Mesorhizobium sp.]
MTTLFAEQALLPDGWRRNVRLTVDGSRIAAVEPEAAAAQRGDERHAILLPGMANLHSHAFQRGMAGLAERRGPGPDTFWSWREVMYRFALTMTPDQAEAVAAQLYVEMLEAGFTRVGEFHYLHHDRDGRPYANLAEMAERIARAAAATGIGLTLLPVFYAHGNFGGAAPREGQRRFLSDVDGFARLLEASRGLAARLPGTVVGVAPHSLRAVAPEALSAVAALAGDGPVHIHAAEQVKEVEDCLAWSGQRPVEWLLDHQDLGPRWCLIHATHMTPDETVRLAGTGAVAGLCPITEANLGDGIFPARAFVESGGAFGIGSDSNVLIGLSDELRQLEYAQRLNHRERNVLAPPGGSNGRALFAGALAGGARALGAGPAGLVAGAAADLVSLDASPVSLAGKRGDGLLDAWIFAGATQVDCVWAGGAKRVEGGRHRDREAVGRRFRAALEALSGGET